MVGWNKRTDPVARSNCINSNFKKVMHSFRNGRDFTIIRNLELRIGHAAKTCAVLQHAPST